MSENTSSAAPLPDSQEQKGGETGAANLDDNAFAQLLAKKEAARVKAGTPPAEDKPSNEESADPAPEKTEILSESESDSGEPEEDKETVPSHESKKLDPDTQKIINRRIGKEVAKTKREAIGRARAEAQLEQLQQRIEAMEGKSQPTQPQTLTDVSDLAGVALLKQEAKVTLRWAEEQLDRDDFPAEGIKTTEGVLTKADLKKIRMNARIALEDQIPEREKFLQAQEEARAQAHETFPFLSDESAPEYAEAQKAFQANPWLKSVPNADWIVGVQILGLKALRDQQEGKKAKPAAKALAKPMSGQSAVTSDAGPSRVLPSTQNGAAVSAAAKRIQESRGASHQDYAALLKARELARHS